MKGAVNVAKLPTLIRVVLSRIGAGTGASVPSIKVTAEVIRVTSSVGRTVMPIATPALIKIAPISKPGRPPVKAPKKLSRLNGGKGAIPVGNGRPPDMNSVTLMMMPIEMEARPPPRSIWFQVNSKLGSPKPKFNPPKKAPPKPRN